MFMLRRQDSNLRPLGYEPNELPLLHSAMYLFAGVLGFEPNASSPCVDETTPRCIFCFRKNFITEFYSGEIKPFRNEWLKMLDISDIFAQAIYLFGTAKILLFLCCANKFLKEWHLNLVSFQ